MKLLVTGASGFLGREVVRAAAKAGHQVMALVRPTASIDGLGWPNSVQVLRGDLRQVGEWSKQLGGVEAIAHLAAAPSGDLPTQFAGTVTATENLLAHLPKLDLRRVVHVSSFSVYDYSAIGWGRTLTEHSPVEQRPEQRDAYTMTKIAQEKLVTEWCLAQGVDHVVIRPGAIIGPSKDWGFGAVLRSRRFDVLFSPGARVPLTFVSNCADAIVTALDAPVPSGSIFNIVDDDLPTYAGFHRIGRRAGKAPRAIYVPWVGVLLIGSAVALINRLAFGGQAKIPEFLDRRRQEVRWKPLRFSNRAAKEGLGWSPLVPMRTAMERSACEGASLPDRETTSILPAFAREQA